MRTDSQRARLTAAALVMAVAVPLAGCSGAASGNQNSPASGGNAHQKASYQKGGSQKEVHHKGSNNGYGNRGGGSY